MRKLALNNGNTGKIDTFKHIFLDLLTCNLDNQGSNQILRQTQLLDQKSMEPIFLKVLVIGKLENVREKKTKGHVLTKRLSLKITKSISWACRISTPSIIAIKLIKPGK